MALTIACLRGPDGRERDSRLADAHDTQRIRLESLTYPEGFDSARARISAAQRLDASRVTKLGSVALGPWTSLGPGPLAQPGGHWGAWTSSIAVDPRDQNTVFIGSPGSGVWKTTDGGRTWTPKTDGAAALAIGAIAIAPSKPDVVYAGTGNWWDGVGLLKSTDNGESWELLPGVFSTLGGSGEFWSSGFIFGALAVSPTDPEVILAGVWYGQTGVAGVYRSTDGGFSWQQVLSGGKGSSIAWDPADPNVVFAAIGDDYVHTKNGVYRSGDGGRTWNASSSGIDGTTLSTSFGIWLTISESSPNVLYASIAGSTGRLGVYKTVDGGSNWSALTIPPDTKLWDSQPIAVHPADPDNVLVGGDVLHRSVDGGKTWDAPTCCPSTFGDYRAIAFSVDGKSLYVGSDGGVFSTQDTHATRVIWTALNDTLSTTLFYPKSPIAIHPTNVSIGLGGAQDLGVMLYTGPSTWTEVLSCDAGTTIIDPVNPSNMYATCNSGQLYRSTKFGAAGSWQTAMEGIDKTDRVAFVPTVAIDSGNSQHLLFGTYRVYESQNNGTSWTAISGDVTNKCSSGITSIAISPVDSTVVTVGSVCGTVSVSTTPGTWTNRTSGLPTRDLTSVIADPRSATTLYVTFSGFSFGADTKGHIFRSTNAAQSWTDISGNLPNVPVNHLAIDPDLDNTLYAATDVGVFVSTDDGRQWNGLGDGLPHAYVQALAIHRPTRTLRASTFGRGMWDIRIGLSAATSAARRFVQ